MSEVGLALVSGVGGVSDVEQIRLVASHSVRNCSLLLYAVVDAEHGGPVLVGEVAPVQRARQAQNAPQVGLVEEDGDGLY